MTIISYMDSEYINVIFYKVTNKTELPSKS